MQIVVATHNEGKLVEIRRILEEDLGADAEKHRTGVRWQPSPAGSGGNWRHLPGERATQGPRCGHTVPVCPLSRMIQVSSSM